MLQSVEVSLLQESFHFFQKTHLTFDIDNVLERVFLLKDILISDGGGASAKSELFFAVWI